MYRSSAPPRPRTLRLRPDPRGAPRVVIAIGAVLLTLGLLAVTGLVACRRADDLARFLGGSPRARDA
jgi:hypothetical protein